MSKMSDARVEDRLRAAQRNPELVEAALALQRNDLPVAERLLKRRLRKDGNDIAALRMLGELAVRVGRLRDAQDLFERALEIAPGFDAARLNYATILHRRNLLPAALDELDTLLARDPANPAAQTLKAAVLARAGEYIPAIAIYEQVLHRFPDQSRLWMSMGHALKTVGRQRDSITAYRRAMSLEEGLGEAWWSLANLKTVRFDASDIDAMLFAVERPRSPSDLYHLHFALGKAFEDRRDYAASFDHYANGNRLRRAELSYDPDRTTRRLAQTRHLMTRDAFAARSGQGLPDSAPIFVVGLPRSGSTLIEQILASHSRVEGTMELPELGLIARDLMTGGTGKSRDGEAIDGDLVALLGCNAAELTALGQRYIERTHIQRKTGRQYFIDKMPSNFEHIGLIRMILPNAKIIDARRHPIATCFSAFKQHFARGQSFTYSLADLGAYYRDYIALMDHYDAVLPGAVHRVLHEDLIRHPDREIRRMLSYCGLAFEASCIDFHQTERPVRTASSEQVRQPLTDAAIDHWRNYDQWLGPLHAVLDDTVNRYQQDLE